MKRMGTIAAILMLSSGIQAKLAWGEIGFGPGQSLDPAEVVREAGGIQVPADMTTEIRCAVAQLMDFRITKTDLGETGWNFIPLIEDFQSGIPAQVARYFRNVSRQSLKRGVSMAYEEEIQTGASPDREKVVTELTQILVETPYSVFRQIVPAEQWGTKIAHHLGGEIRVVEKDPAGRAVRQLERMVLSGVPFADMNFDPVNQDMTKAEIILYGKDGAKVYWRVYHSDNGSTKADVGSVEFRSYGDNSVLVTFHSAHKIRGLELVPPVAKSILEKTFLDHARRYQAIAERAAQAPCL